MVPVVKPVVRPLFATDMPTAGATTALLITPMSSIAPVASIVPGLNCAIAASTFEPNGENARSEEHTSELQSPCNLVCRLLLEKKKNYSLAEIRKETGINKSTIYRYLES